MRDLSPIQIAANEEAKRRKYDGAKLAHDLGLLNVPAVPAIHLPIDVMWTCDGEICAGDLKTVPDFIASYMDGRLHDQVTAMQAMNCRFMFILIEGDAWSEDGGPMVSGKEMRGHPLPEASAASKPSVIFSS